MFHRLPLAVGEIQRRDGYFTSALYLRSQTSNEVELRLGYRAGRLSEGWWLLFLTEMPNVHQFQYRGYSHLSGGIERGHIKGNEKNLNSEQLLAAEGYNLDGNVYDRKGMKQRSIESFQLNGSSRLAKVIPVAAPLNETDVPDYPPGSGIPQWTLVVPLQWRVAALIAPREMYLGHYL